MGKRKNLEGSYYQRNKELCKQRAKEWGQANPERLKQSKNRYRNNNKDKVRLSVKLWQWRQSGVLDATLENYNKVLKIQDGVCALCKKAPPENRMLALDHCHKTGIIRGLLCTRCNVGLGYLESMLDDEVTYGQIKKYLHSFSKNSTPTGTI